jgi:hypothetical protein
MLILSIILDCNYYINQNESSVGAIMARPRNQNKPVLVIEGLKVYLKSETNKKTGKARLKLRIRQETPKRWKVHTTLAKHNAIDIRFEEK